MPHLKGYRFPLNTPDLEELLAERGMTVSRDTVRQWINRFDCHLADCVKRVRPGAADQSIRALSDDKVIDGSVIETDSLNFLEQQDRFGHFSGFYNNEGPHQALCGAYPGQLYTPSVSAYQPPPQPEYPFHDRSVRVTHCVRNCIGKRKIDLSQVLAGQIVGIKQVDNQTWRVSFLNYDLGLFDNNDGRVEPVTNPLKPEKL